MRKKTLTVFLLILSINMTFIGSLGVAKVNTDSVTWHEWLSKGLTFYYVVETTQTGTPTLGGHLLTPGDNLTLKIVEDPHSSYGDLFTDNIPDWLEIYYKDIALTNSMLSLLEIQYLSGFLLPIQFNWDNGTHSSLTDFLAHYTPSLFDSTTFRVSDNGLECITNWINANESIHTEFITAMENGVTNWASLHTPSYSFMIRFTGETDYEEEEEEDGDSPTSIKWSNVITKGTLLAWNITTFDQYNTSSSFTIGGTIIKEGDIVQFGLVKNPPTNARDWMDPEGPPDWVKIFINTNEIDINQIGDEGRFFLFLVIPIEFSFTNGTKLYLKDFFDLYIGEDDNFINYSLIEIDSTYYDVTWCEEWDDEGSKGYANYFVRSSRASGVTVKMDVNASEGLMTWDFVEEAATVDPEEAKTKTIEPEYSVSLSYPPAELTSGFEVICSISLLIISIWVTRKRR